MQQTNIEIMREALRGEQILTQDAIGFLTRNTGKDKYIILVATTVADLQKKVNDSFKEGYHPKDSLVVVNEHLYMQTCIMS